MTIPEYIIYLYNQGFTVSSIVDKVSIQVIGIDNALTKKDILHMVENTILEHYQK